MDAGTPYLVGTVKTLMLHTIKYSYGTPVLWRQLCELKNDINVKPFLASGFIQSPWNKMEMDRRAAHERLSWFVRGGGGVATVSKEACISRRTGTAA
jgi:hypothetical protein